MVGEETAEQRTGHAGGAERRAEVSLVAAALAGRHDVRDDRLREHDETARAESLEGTERDQCGERRRDAAQHAAGEEHDDGRLEQPLAPVEVAELAVERRRDRRREQIRRDDPRQMVEAAEVADDRRQRGRDDRLVECREQQAEHEPAEHDEHLAVRQRRAVSVVHGRGNPCAIASKAASIRSTSGVACPVASHCLSATRMAVNATPTTSAG